MTDERIAILALCERIYRFHPNEDTMAEWIAAALAARERAVWLEAANKPGQHHIDDIGQCDAVSWMKGYLACKHDYKVWCRQQAEEVKP